MRTSGAAMGTLNLQFSISPARRAMNLNAVERFLAKLPIRDRDSHRRVPFLLNYNQSVIHAKAREQQEAGLPIRILTDKSRRVGVSSWSEGLLFCHNLSLPGSHSLIAAHQFKSSKALFEVPRAFADALPFLNIRAVEREMSFPFQNAHSLMQIVTAGKDTSGRGFTLSALHSSEAAHYVSSDSFISLLPAVSSHKDTIIIIESTPNGMDGDGEVFYQMWMDAIEGRSEYKAVFLSWTDDPACVAPAAFAKNAPVDEEERELLKMGLNKSQLAWRRQKISSPECGGSIEVFHQEYPVTWQESFIVSGSPAFEREEMRWARKNIREPKWKGIIERDLHGKFTVREHHKGDLLIWEDPIPGHYYYIGVDAARGEEGRDFSAAVGFDGVTGHQVFRYAAHVVPEIFSCYVNSLGRHYNRAMVNPELTGGYGYNVMATLRDILRYPNLYFWKGKDDRPAGARHKTVFGFETTMHTRVMLFETFRVALREASGTDGEFGITLYDETLASQIEMCTRRETGRIDVERGKDDILFAAMLAYIAVRQWAPPRVMNRTKSTTDEEDEQVRAKIGARGDVILDDASLSLQKHHQKIVDWKPEREEDWLGGA